MWRELPMNGGYLSMAIGIPLAIVQSARSIDRFHFRGIVRVFKISRHGLRAAFVLAAALTVGAQAQAATIDFGSDSWQQPRASSATQWVR